MLLLASIAIVTAYWILSKKTKIRTGH